jgi:hypothetical protein
LCKEKNKKQKLMYGSGIARRKCMYSYDEIGVLLAVDGEPSVARKNVDDVGDDEAKKIACLASLIMSFIVGNHRLERCRAAAAR